MNDAVYSRLAETINKHESDILKEWLDNQKAEGTLSKSLEADGQQQSRVASLAQDLAASGFEPISWRRNGLSYETC